ncbi:MAG: LysR family transcriptional regulator [Pseudomonadota bacterium]|nr:LysR family transcriptional regulator [Pseudomonadota bacterium]
MNAMHLDLNLLLVLEALLEERSVTRAAARMGLTQSALSHALGRLREHIGDPLFVRGPTGMVPTPRAEALAGPVHEALTTIRGALDSRPFDPSTARGVVRLGTTDYAAFVLVPGLTARLRAEAPGLDLHVSSIPSEGITELVSGAVDVVITRPLGGDVRGGLYQQVVFEDDFLCVLRAGHPAADRFDLDAFLAWPHVLVAPRGQTGGVVDTVLATRGLARRVAVLLPHFLVAPHIVAGSDAIVTLAARVARRLAEPLGLILRPPPLALPGFTMAMVWHERTHRDPAARWVRERVMEVGSAS